MRIDVLITLGPDDLDYLFDLCLTSCFRNFLALNKVIIVTPNRSRLLEKLSAIEINGRRIKILEDSEVLPNSIMELPGWSRQQAIRLCADKFSDGKFVACLSADTIFLSEVNAEDVLRNGSPILYFNRYPEKTKHLNYERRRVKNVSKILKVKPHKSLPLGDFIMDFMVFDVLVLKKLRSYLTELYGEGFFEKILPREVDSYDLTVAFGEWTLYSVFLLDFLKVEPTIKNSNSQYLKQVHSEGDLKNFDFNSKIVHFVSKGFDRTTIESNIIHYSQNAPI